MKLFNNYSFMAIAIVFAITMLAGCKKENTPKNAVYDALPSDLQTLYDQMPSRNYNFISVVGDGILSFETVQQYQQTCEQLQNDCDLWDSLFHENYRSLKESELMDLQDSLGYDEFLPIVMFEENLNVSGNMLFDTQQEAIRSWVDNEFKGENPTDDIFILEGEQAVHNIYREVCINDTIYQFRTDATVVVPLALLDTWLQVRHYPTQNLEIINGIVINDYTSDEDNSKVEKVRFPCDDSGEFNASNLPSVFSGLDYSYWIVKGRRGICNDNIMTSKLVNFKYHKTNKNGVRVYKRCKRNCSIITTHQVFYKEHYNGLPAHLLFFDTSTVNKSLPSSKQQKVAHASVAVFLTPGPVTYVTSRYVLGVYPDVTMKIRIDGHEITKTLNLTSKRGR